LKMINGITKEFGEVIFDGARVPATNMIELSGPPPPERAGRGRLGHQAQGVAPQ
jgi:alkylation response protein AidB-like acyl-CoA dehydrogenase